MSLGEQLGVFIDEGVVNTWYGRFLRILFNICHFSFGRSVAHSYICKSEY